MKKINKSSLAYKALTDIWKFAELIEFKGGVDNFVKVHFDMVRPLEQQLTKEYANKVKSGKLLEVPTTFVCSVPRGHLKSTVRTTLYCLWRIYRNPEIRICVGTNVENLANALIRELRSYLENEVLQIRVWNNRPHIEGDMIPELSFTRRKRINNANAVDDYMTDAAERKVIWNNKALQVNRSGVFKEPTIDTTNAGAINTGNHYDVIIFDDVVDFRNSDTMLKQDKLARWCFDIESQLDPIRVVKLPNTDLPDILGGTKVINGTKYYDGDYTNQAILAAKGNPEEGIPPDTTISVFERNIYNNGINADDGYLWESKFNDSIIQLLQRRMDKKTFASQYLNTTASDFGNSQSNIKFTRFGDDRISSLSGNINYYDEAGNRHIVNIRGVCDIGIKNDFSVCILGFYIDKDTFVVFDVIHNQGNLSKFLEELYEACMLYNVSYVGIEANGVGAGCITALKLIHDRENNGRRFPFYDFYSTDSKETRIAYAMTFLTSDVSKIILTPKVNSNSLFVRYVKGYPYAEHDDFIDCLGIALRMIPKRPPEFIPNENSKEVSSIRGWLTRSEYFLLTGESVAAANSGDAYSPVAANLVNL